MNSITSEGNHTEIGNLILMNDKRMKNIKNE